MLKPRPIYCPNVILLHAENNDIFSINEAKSIVESFTHNNKVITVYIHHEIDDLNEAQIVVKNNDYAIYKEIRKSGGGIASQLLTSGSDYVYYIKADEENYRAAFIHINDILSNDYPIICIANYLIAQLKSGAIVLENKNEETLSELKDLVYFPDKVFTTESLLKHKITFVDKKIEVS